MQRCVILGLVGFLLLTLAALAAPPGVQAVPNPGAIAWKAPARAFIVSLYRGVLGRAPENQQVVEGWAAQVRNTAGSRLHMFERFLGCQEYQNSTWASRPREYNVYQAEQKNTKRWKYYYGKFAGAYSGRQIGGGPYTRGTAAAYAEYYKAWVPTW